MSAGQEYIAATFSKILEKFNVTEKQIFIQHRGHSIYLSFGAVLEELIYELLGVQKDVQMEWVDLHQYNQKKLIYMDMMV